MFYNDFNFECEKIISILFSNNSFFTYVEYQNDGKMNVALVVSDPDKLIRFLKKFGIQTPEEFNVLVLHNVEGRYVLITL